MTSEKTVTYSHSNTYSTINEFSDATKNVWIVFHGLGSLSRYFIKKFERLNPKENYFIAPQAPSKYYLDNSYDRVGSSWLTKEDTLQEIENVLNYVDEVWKKEKPHGSYNLIILGFSQGVSIATRWIARREIQCKYLLIHSGSIPNELNANDFMNLLADTQVRIIYGTEDEFINNERISKEIKKGKSLFGQNLRVHSFEGKHEISFPLIKKIIQNS